MTELVLTSQLLIPARAERSVPCRAHEDRLMTRAIVASVVAHVAVGLGFFIGSFIAPDDQLAAPINIDVTLVELSALETALPPQAIPSNNEPKAQAVIPPPPVPEKKIEPPAPKKESKIVSTKTPEKVKATPPKQETSSAPSNGTPSNAAPVGGASVGGGDDAVEKARISYQDMVATMLAKAKRYPERAIRNRVTGSGLLRLKIAPEGSVVSVEVVNSTQSSILDEELHRMVERAAPFPAFPPGMMKDQLALLVPISFRLDS